jgi:hypothetical protein
VKVCTKCNLEKEDIDFSKDKNQCKLCVSLYQKTYQAEYRKAHKESTSLYNKEYYLLNEKEIKEYKKEWSLDNKDYLSEYKNEWGKTKYHNDPSYRIRKRISWSIRNQLKKLDLSKGGESCLEKLPYSIQELKEHLESQFESWMNWSNHGVLKNWDDNNPETWTWQIDHIIPQTDLPYTSMEDDNFKKCWALENLRPLSAKQNIVEGSSRMRHKK